MTRYYIADNTAPRGFVELTESEWYALMGDETTSPYDGKVYRGEIAMEEVPEDIREAVAAVVAAKVERWGLYTERELTAREALAIITGGGAGEA